MRRGRLYRAQRILSKKGERAEIAIRKPNAGKCDGKNIGGYTDLVLIGPASICICVSQRLLVGRPRSGNCQTPKIEDTARTSR